jgi:hypothetical protein
LSSDDDGDIRSLLKTILPRVTNGEGDLLDIDIVKEKQASVQVDLSKGELIFGDEEYEKVPITRIPRNSTLRISVRIRQRKTRREISAITKTPCADKALHHPATVKDVDIQEIGTIPLDADRDKKVKRAKSRAIKEWTIRIINVLISLINSMINFGLIRVQ